MRAVIYARVSSRKQAEARTIEAQLAILPDVAARLGAALVRAADHYVDDGRSGKAGQLEQRDALARLMRDAAAGAFDVVVVFDVDRLTRSEDIAERGAILGAFQRAGVKIATASGQVLDLSSSMGDLFVGLQGFFAADWLRKHRERIKAGKDRAIARGKKPAGPTPFGLRYERDTGTWSIDATESELVREMFRRVAAGESCEQIARDLARRGIARPRGGEWIRERVWQIVTSRTYVGQWKVDKRRDLSIAVPAIVDLELWERAQAALVAHGKRGLRRTKHVYLLEGLATCAVCGAQIGIASAQTGGRRVPCASRYVCAHRRRPPFAAPRCTLPYQETAAIDDRLWRQLVQVLSRPDLLDDQVLGAGDVDADRAAWQRDLEGADRRLAALVRAEVEHLERRDRGQLSAAALDARLNAIVRERAQLERQREAARRALVAVERSATRSGALQEAVAIARAQLADASQPARRALVEALLEPGSVTVSATEVVATLRIRALAPEGSASTRTSHEADLRLRIVA